MYYYLFYYSFDCGSNLICNLGKIINFYRISMIIHICSFVWANSSSSLFCNLSSIVLSLSSAWLSFNFSVSNFSQDVGWVPDVKLKWIPPNYWELVPNTLVGQALNPRPCTRPGCSFPKASSRVNTECYKEFCWLKATFNFSYINAKYINTWNN